FLVAQLFRHALILAAVGPGRTRSVHNSARRRTKAMIRAAVVALVCATVAGCSTVGSSDSGERTVVLVTHDSFTMKPEVLDEFRKSSGIKIDVRKTGDAGALTNQLVLTKGNPLGDVAYGVDTAFASRALKEGVFDAYRSPEADKGPRRYAIDTTDRLTAVDAGDVCL